MPRKTKTLHIAFTRDLEARIDDKSSFLCKTCISFNACIHQKPDTDKWCWVWLPYHENHIKDLASVDVFIRLKILKNMAESIPKIMGSILRHGRIPETDVSLVLSCKQQVTQLLTYALQEADKLIGENDETNPDQ